MGMPLGGFSTCSTNYNEPAPNPSPSRWQLISLMQFNNAYVMKVLYLDCTNFEGVKIMVYKGRYEYRKYLDPHFDESESSPIARFKPTEEGWKMALELAENIGE